MTPAKVTLRLSRQISDFMLADIKAIIDSQQLQLFINALDEAHYATLECPQSEHNCALLAAAIIFWYQLGHISHLTLRNGRKRTALQTLDRQALFALLRTPEAVLHIS